MRRQRKVISPYGHGAESNISEIRAFLPASGGKLFYSPWCSEPPGTDLRPAFFTPPKKRPCGAKAPFLFATPKDEGHRASLRGSQLYLLEREREMGLKKE